LNGSRYSPVGHSTDRHVPAGAFLLVASPNSIATLLPNAYYKSTEECTAAIAEAMGVEYQAIVDPGFLLQIDAPALVVMWDWWFADRTFEEWHALAQTQDVIRQ
jgi:methionine synthase II (cobalamin-independent)